MDKSRKCHGAEDATTPTFLPLAGSAVVPGTGALGVNAYGDRPWRRCGIGDRSGRNGCGRLVPLVAGDTHGRCGPGSHGVRRRAGEARRNLGHAAVRTARGTAHRELRGNSRDEADGAADWTRFRCGSEPASWSGVFNGSV